MTETPVAKPPADSIQQTIAPVLGQPVSSAACEDITAEAIAAPPLLQTPADADAEELVSSPIFDDASIETEAALLEAPVESQAPVSSTTVDPIPNKTADLPRPLIAIIAESPGEAAVWDEDPSDLPMADFLPVAVQATLGPDSHRSASLTAFPACRAIEIAKTEIIWAAAPETEARSAELVAPLEMALAPAFIASPAPLHLSPELPSVQVDSVSGAVPLEAAGPAAPDETQAASGYASPWTYAEGMALAPPPLTQPAFCVSEDGAALLPTAESAELPLLGRQLVSPPITSPELVLTHAPVLAASRETWQGAELNQPALDQIGAALLPATEFAELTLFCPEFVSAPIGSAELALTHAPVLAASRATWQDAEANQPALDQIGAALLPATEFAELTLLCPQLASAAIASSELALTYVPVLAASRETWQGAELNQPALDQIGAALLPATEFAELTLLCPQLVSAPIASPELALTHEFYAPVFAARHETLHGDEEHEPTLDQIALYWGDGASDQPAPAARAQEPLPASPRAHEIAPMLALSSDPVDRPASLPACTQEMMPAALELASVCSTEAPARFNEPGRSSTIDVHPELATQLMADIAQGEAANPTAEPRTLDPVKPSFGNSVRIKNWRLRLTFAKPA